jgi:predicted alpha/beta hydrolase family esterase
MYYKAMKRLYIVHRWDANPQADWYPWLKHEMESLGVETHTPQMPNPSEPDIAVWVNFLAQQVGRPDQNTYFVGHSLGCQTIIRYLETISTEVGGAIFVAGWFELQGLETEDEKRIAAPWLENPIDFVKVRQNLSKAIAILSINDPFVDYQANKYKFEKDLKARVLSEGDSGHLTYDDGVTEIDSLRRELHDMMNVAPGKSGAVAEAEDYKLN